MNKKNVRATRLTWLARRGSPSPQRSKGAPCASLLKLHLAGARRTTFPK